MKVIRENSTEYYPFYKFLEDLSNNYYIDKEISSSLLNSGGRKDNNNYFVKYNYIFNILSSFDRETLSSTETKKIYAVFKQHLKKILPTKESSLLFFDQNYTGLIPLDKNSESLTNTSVNSFYKEGVLNDIFEKKIAKVLPLLSSYESGGSKYNFLIVPIFEENKRRGLLSLLTTSREKNISEFDKKLVEVLLLLAMSRLDKSILRKKINTIHEELKTYQAKLSNDYRLAAIGEMTKGIVEDILSPLQVIVSQVDLFNKEKSNNFEIDLLKAQIRKINETVSRLIKFVDTNPYSIKIHPCNLNEAVTDFYTIFKSTLQNNRIECELDLQDDIPPILSHSNYLTQILTHLFGMIKNKNKGEGAIIVQTRFQSEEIILKLVSSIDLSDNNSVEGKNGAGNLNIKIIDNLMLRHEGKCSIVNNDIGSSVVTLTFPLRRKLRV
jgi:Txe/YoeB family toxin of Txe-Axe toxin-antitoxin module